MLLISICCSVQDIRIRGLGRLVKLRPTKVYAALKIFLVSFDKTFDRKISCWDSQLDVSARRFEGIDKKKQHRIIL